jgi:DNA repair protein RecN (Recombination protein N)
MRMLQTLSIRNFVIVESLELDFALGFSVLTGETGAGKSILIDALSLALGARGESGMIRVGCERAEIAASFDVQNLSAVKVWLQDAEINLEQEPLLLRRVIYADGRSRAFINGVSATLQQLKELGEYLVDIYSQHAHHSLLKTHYQRQVVDEFAEQISLAKQVAQQFQAWQQLREQREALEQNAAAFAEELAELRDQVRELAPLAMSSTEWDELQQEHSKLLHGASLLTGGEACRELLSEGEFAAIRQLSTAQHQLGELIDYDPSLQEAVEAVDAAIIQLQEADRFLNRYVQRMELDPERLAEVEAKMQAIHAAARKYKIRPELLAETLHNNQQRIAELSLVNDDGTLAQRETEAAEQYTKLAQQLSQGRQAAAIKLNQSISQQMQSLSLAGGQFIVALKPQPATAFGLEQIEFLVAGHAGVEPKPLAKVASGGELSRISLAIRVTTAQQDGIPTMIFDEVDVGIGGGVAEVVGGLLKTLGLARQVLVITHLPQVAAQGTVHYQVSKSVNQGQTLSQIKILDDPARIEEIARMLGGVAITETTRQHAREMLGFSA